MPAPAAVEAGSAVRPRRTRSFQEFPPVAEGEMMDAGGNGERGTVAAAAAAAAASGATVQKFELQEDPSFWKDHNVQVIIRQRPLSTSEISLQGHSKCVRQDSGQTITWTGHPESRFTFDHIADEHVSQENLFKVAGVPMVENCVAGYNSCMFAYGQTGSGKTHTMLGDIEGGTRRHSVNCGMTPRVFEFLFSRIQKEKESRRDEKLQFTCRCSFLEIYNEQILDLLDPSSVNLQIREDARKGVYVENLTEFEVSSARDVMQQLIQGAANRKVASTNMNRASSRSHSVFTCVIESKWESQGVTHHRFARLNLVDLAGSERQKSSGAEGERLKEATNINKSLSTLGLVIMNLVSISNKKSLHVPYRDSKLTFLLQDSLGGNSKTIIIANISPSNCCALETLSTLKFAQRAKFIRNNAIINEDASGDVLSMRLQIQQLKKEVNRLRGLVHGATENAEGDGSTLVSASPGSFKWEGQGSFSPLTFDKRFTQRKEYDAALVAAIKRDQDKEASLKALAESKQAAEQLAIQREKEVRSLQMRLRFREEGIKRLEAVASEKLSAEAHLLQEKEELLKEIDMVRSQVDRNPEVTRFAMENLQLKEEIRRLQSFVEEGEREMMNEQITILQDKLLEALDWKLMHEKDAENLPLSWDSSGNEENEFLQLQAIQNQREIEALRKNLTFCLGAKEKLERRVDELVSQLEERKPSTSAPNEDIQLLQATDLVASVQDNSLDDQMELKAMVDAIALASQKEAEAHETAIALAEENEELREKLRILIEDNNKLIELYEHAVAEEVTRNAGNAIVLGVVEDQNDNSRGLKGSHENHSHEDHYTETKDLENLEHQLHEMHEENEKLMGLYERAMQERDEFKRMLVTYEYSKSRTKETSPEKLVQLDERQGCQNQTVENFKGHSANTEVPEELLHLVRTKVELVQDKLGVAEEGVKYFQLLERTTVEIDELYENTNAMDHDIQLKQTQISTLKLALEKIQNRRTVLENKFLALKAALRSFSSKANYWEQREARATLRLESCSKLLEQKKEELSYLQKNRDETTDALLKARDSEVELRGKIDNLKLKLQDSEVQRKETEKVLFAIDNIERSDLSIQKSLILGKASELLKSEEERTMLSSDLKKFREQLAFLQKEVSSLTKKSGTFDVKIQSLEADINSGMLSQQEAELGLQQVIEEKNMLSEMTEVGRADLQTFLVDYQECIFMLDLKVGEIKLFEDELNEEVRNFRDLKTKGNLAMEKLKHLMKNKSPPTASDAECFSYVSHKVERELDSSQMILVDAKALLVPITDI